MNFHILTLFPEMVMDGLNTSIIGRAVNAGYLSIEAVNIRDYAFNKHQSVDDYPYGGGAGMLMQAEPVYLAYKAVEEKIARRGGADQEAPCQETESEASSPEKRASETGGRPRTVYLSPQGAVFTQKMAEELAQEEDLILLCGHYEGIDERVLEEIVTDYVSIGDYVLTGGELPAMVICDCVARYVDGVISGGSLVDESFSDGLLEYPQYTRPAVYRGVSVPEVLLSGNHAEIDRWRREQSEKITRERRPDLLKRD